MLTSVVLVLFLVGLFNVDSLPIATNQTKQVTVQLNEKQRAMLSEYKMDRLAEGLLRSQIIPKFEVPKKFNLTQIEKEIKDFGINGLKEEKHIEAVPIERDGKINVDFHKELFLGNHELFEAEIQNSPEKRKEKLAEIFRKADLNKDSFLTKDELLDYAMTNIEMHLKEAKDKNLQLFLLIDSNQDGRVTWHEYFVLYIKFHNLNDSSIKESDVFEFVRRPLTNDVERELLKIRFRWTEADRAEDNELDPDEFLAFRHPEIVGQSFKHLAQEMILRLDRNEDKKLNETEFVSMPETVLEDPSNKEWVEMDRRWAEDQKREFHEMDENGDGFLTEEELTKAFDPRNRRHISKEIQKLMTKIDDSPKDERISLEEIEKHVEDFTDIRVLDAEKVLHDEM